MSDAENKPHLYGTADQPKRRRAPKQGLRGEGTAPSAKPTQRRRAKTVKVEEESGSAYAERVAIPAAAAREAGNDRRPAVKRGGLFAVGALAAAGAVLGAWWARRMRAESAAGDGPVAFRHAQTDRENFDQTRDAGPEHIRDEAVGRRWDEVDEAVDESFPASDPPATY